MIQKVIVGMRNKKINVECLPTEDAISAYNYLVAEDRLVAATLIPPEEMVQVCKFFLHIITKYKSNQNFRSYAI
jgi:hypothetical protein